MPNALAFVDLPLRAYETDTEGTELRYEACGCLSFADLKKASSDSGMSEVSILLSGIAANSAKRFFEITIEVLSFVRCCLAGADDAGPSIPSGMNYTNNN